jgi:sugar phosphate isomerase/epimerase
MKSAVTLSLAAEARGGPFVFWDDLDSTFALVRELGFDAVELFLPGPDGDYSALASRIAAHGLEVAALGTGAGWVLHRLSLTHPDNGRRTAARDFIRRTIDLAAGWNAPAIIGSMQGRSDSAFGRPAALELLGDALQALAAHAAGRGQILFYEPLNRYETDLFNRQADAGAWLNTLGAKNVRLLSDLFHMNIEEPDIASALVKAGALVGHVHFADSNRRAMGFGHTDAVAVMAALSKISYSGYLSAEILPLPDGASAARQTIAVLRRLSTGTTALASGGPA